MEPTKILSLYETSGGDLMSKYQVFNIKTGEMREVNGNEPLDPRYPNLFVYEFASKDGNQVVPYDPELPKTFQMIRDKFGPLTINSGFRTITHNANTPGAFKDSRHLYAIALDIKTPTGMKDENFLIQVIGLIGPDHGFGLYSGRIHIDLRGHFDFWDSRK